MQMNTPVDVVGAVIGTHSSSPVELLTGSPLETFEKRGLVPNDNAAPSPSTLVPLISLVSLQ